MWISHLDQRPNRTLHVPYERPQPMTSGVSKHATLAQLLRIKQDNYLGVNGKDYCVFEVESRIIEIKTRQASALKGELNPWIGSAVPEVKRAIKFLLKQTKPMFILDMANERYIS